MCDGDRYDAYVAGLPALTASGEAEGEGQGQHSAGNGVAKVKTESLGKISLLAAAAAAAAAAATVVGNSGVERPICFGPATNATLSCSANLTRPCLAATLPIYQSESESADLRGIHGN